MGGQKKATSKAYQVRLSLNAIQNIDEITGYLAFINHQPLSAINVGNAFFETIDRIGTNPLAFFSVFFRFKIVLKKTGPPRHGPDQRIYGV
jgi:hypothetical protein